jgi:hypothetical protein
MIMSIARRMPGALGVMCAVAVVLNSSIVSAQVVPGTGEKITKVGDDMEAEDWEYYPQLPKASQNIDRRTREPVGMAKNELWYESSYRGAPDIVRRVATPAGGLEGSKGALLLRSRFTGVPGRPRYDQQQDDFMLNVESKLGGFIPVKRKPNFLVRVWIPPFEKWEQRSGVSFGVRASVDGNGPKGNKSYWPGMFIQFNRKDDGYEKDHAVILVRAQTSGHDLEGPKIEKSGWWTFGMSFTPDGAAHFYASEGVDALTKTDRLHSSFPYRNRAHRFNTVFFNIVNLDGGDWSTPWILDDPEVYFVRPNSLTNTDSTTRTR